LQPRIIGTEIILILTEASAPAVLHPNFANNLFASSCDNLHPIIAFGTCFSVAIKFVAFCENTFLQTSKGRPHPGVNK
jgi:hypothetical protein